MKRHIIVFLIFFTFSKLFSQSRKEMIDLANTAFENGAYSSAIKYYTQLLENNSKSDYTHPYEIKQYVKIIKSDNKKKIAASIVVNDIYITRKLAELYRLNHEYKNAEIWYKKIVDDHSLEYPNEHFWYADALMKNEKYAAAIKEFNLILPTTQSMDVDIYNLTKNKLQGCYAAIDSNNFQKNASVLLLDSIINKGPTSFSLNYFGDYNTVQFSSVRSVNNIQNTSLSCDIYTLKKTKTGWKNLNKLDKAINTDNHEAAGVLSTNGNNYYFTRWSESNKNECAIYLSKKRNGKWLPAEILDEHVNIPGYKSMQPALSADNKTLYFSSNQSGSIGKMDIWYSTIDDEGKCEASAINMGHTINTFEDEVSPFFYSPTATLYYSSDGLPGIGGLDIFKSTYTKSGIWTIPENLKAPINSSKDDAYFILDNTQRQGYLSSDREECIACNGGACYKLYSFEKQLDSYVLRGNVISSETDRPIANALITINGIDKNADPVYKFSDSTGQFSYVVNEYSKLKVVAQKNKFFAEEIITSVNDSLISKNTEFDFFISPIPYGEIVVPGLNFDPGKAILTKDAKIVLNKLADFLLLNSNLYIEISSHTDERGNDDINMKLSQSRAQACMKYLISKGIALSRITAKGYGETRLLFYDPKTIEERQKNERTAFRCVKETEIRNK
ncbi:MAG: OmpA family protein [Bacteroidia bacterium]